MTTNDSRSRANRASSRITHVVSTRQEGYTLKVAELSVLGVTTPDFEVHVFASSSWNAVGSVFADYELLDLAAPASVALLSVPSPTRTIAECIGGGGWHLWSSFF